MINYIYEYTYLNKKNETIIIRSNNYKILLNILENLRNKNISIKIKDLNVKQLNKLL